MNIGNAFQSIQIPPEGMERSPWATSTNPNFIDGKYVKNLTVNQLNIDDDGFIRSGKTSFTDNSNSGYFISNEGVYIGSVSDTTKLKYNIGSGTLDFVGKITATTGSSINTSYLDGDILNSNLDIAALGWSINCSFSAYNYRRVDWGSGTLRTAKGASYAIGGGNTGNISSVTYIYFDVNYPTSLQTTTNASNAVGAGKILVAVATNVTSPKLAEFQVFGGKGSNQLITASNIAANTITGNEIAANSITSGKISATAIDGMTITGATIRTNNAAYPHVKMDSLGITISGSSVLNFQTSSGNWAGYIAGIDGNYGKDLEINDSSGEVIIYGRHGVTIHSSASANEMTVISGNSIKIETNSAMGDGLIFLNSDDGVRVKNKLYVGANVYSNNYDLGGGYYLNRSGGVLQANNFTNFYIGGYTFRPVGFTFKDGSGANRYIVVLATADPS